MPARYSVSVSSDFERIGGETALRAIIGDFVARVFDDVMIGFHFRQANRARIEEMEFQHAAEHLGGPHVYEGRPLRAAHAPHRIMGGQFERRLKILTDVLEKHDVPASIRERWLAHNRALRGEITAYAGSDCQ